MKRLYINICICVLAFFALVATGAATELSAREVYNVSAGWIYFTGEDASTDNSLLVNLPHIQTNTGVINYLKDIDIPLNWEGRRVFLRVGGASRVADVFIGGAHVATHRGGGSTFTVEITDRLRPGTAASVRIVVASSPSLDVLPTAGSEKTYGGIFRGVELIVCDPLSVSPVASLTIDSPDTRASSGSNTDAGGNDKNCRGADGIWITTDRLTKKIAEGRVRLSLLTPAGEMPQDATAFVRFSDAEGNLVAQSSLPVTEPTLEIPFSLSDPHLWQGIEDPYLYNVEVTLSSGEEAIRTDSLTVTTGFRTVAIDAANNFTLNGKPMKLHGVILHRDRMIVGTALTPFQIAEDVDFIREMGANAVRIVGGQHNDYFYTLCDEAGLLVWNDGPFTGAAYPTDIDFVDTEAFRENGRRQMSDMISQLYCHPSVVMWGVFSNVTTRGGDPLPYIRELNTLAHTLDPHRLTAASSVQDGAMNFVTDLVSFDLSLGWQTGLPDEVVPWLASLKKGWPDLRAGISYSAGASIFHQSEMLERPLLTSNYHPEGWQTFFHEQYMRYAVDAPGLWGVFVGYMFDSGAAKVASGALAASPADGGGGVDDRGLVTFDRKDRKDSFWLYKANWNRTEPFVHIVGSRLDGRTNRRQMIRVYSNLPEVELFMGGKSLGRATGEYGIFVWNDINMRTGVNRLEARATGAIGGVATPGTVSGGAEDSESTTVTEEAPVTSTSGSPASGGEYFEVTDRATISIYPASAPTLQSSATSTVTAPQPAAASTVTSPPPTSSAVSTTPVTTAP